MKTFVISDTHFGHFNIIRYCNRPFKDANHMDEVMIENWNSVVGRGDKVIHVGDLCFGDQYKAEKILARLNGKILLCRGNHDKRLWKWYLGHGHEQKCRVLPVENWHEIVPNIFFSHYPEDVSLKEHATNNMFHVHGHIHDRITNDPTKFNACVEHLNYTPIELEAVINTLCASSYGSPNSIAAEKSIQTNQEEIVGVVS